MTPFFYLYDRMLFRSIFQQAFFSCSVYSLHYRIITAGSIMILVVRRWCVFSWRWEGGLHCPFIKMRGLGQEAHSHFEKMIRGSTQSIACNLLFALPLYKHKTAIFSFCSYALYHWIYSILLFNLAVNNNKRGTVYIYHKTYL